jgi:hypothetical protein
MVSVNTNGVPAWLAAPLRDPGDGHGVSSAAAAMRFCATHSASVRCLRLPALSMDCDSARMPAASATCNDRERDQDLDEREATVASPCARGHGARASTGRSPRD